MIEKEQVIEMLKKQMELLSNCSSGRSDIAHISIAMKVLAEFILNPNSMSEENHAQD